MLYVSYSDGAGAVAHTSCEYHQQNTDGNDVYVVSTGAAAVTPQGDDLPVLVRLQCPFPGESGWTSPIVRESSGAGAVVLPPAPSPRRSRSWELCVAGSVEWSDGSVTDLPQTCLSP